MANLEEIEIKLNNICREKGFELTLTEKRKIFNNVILLEIIVKRLDIQNCPDIIIKIRCDLERGIDREYIAVLGEEGKWLDDIYYNDFIKVLYNYLNKDKVKFICEFIGGKYDNVIMSREEIEKISYGKKFNNITFEEMVRYIPFSNNYLSCKRPIIDYGVINYKFIANSN